MQAVRKPECPESGLANTVGWLSLLRRSGNALSNPLHRAVYICCTGAAVRLPLLSVPLLWHKRTGRVFGAVSLTREQHFQRNGATDLWKMLCLTKLPP